MGVLRPFIGAGPASVEGVEPSDRLLTPATGLSASRPILSGVAASMLLKGQRPVTPVVMAMAATDMEGRVARFFDKHFPEAEIGSSKFGAEADQIADTLGILILSGAALAAPRISIAGKVAIGVALGQEGRKAAWALNAANTYKNSTRSEENPRGEKLVIPSLPEGKEAMAEKLVGVVFATAINDFDDPLIRRGLEVAALSFAGAGALRGERVRREYDRQYQEMMTDLGPAVEFSTFPDTPMLEQ
jgi:hypothetical protein